MIVQADGDLVGAATHYRDAAAVARAGGDGHCAAVALQNHAAALAERGLHGAALPALTTAIAELGALGKVAELARSRPTARCRWWRAASSPAAEAAATRAAERAAAAGLPVPAFYAALVHGDIARRRGDPATAAARYRAAWDAGRGRRPARSRPRAARAGRGRPRRRHRRRRAGRRGGPRSRRRRPRAHDAPAARSRGPG
jgi:hypothetical protein